MKKLLLLLTLLPYISECKMYAREVEPGIDLICTDAEVGSDERLYWHRMRMNDVYHAYEKKSFVNKYR